METFCLEKNAIPCSVKELLKKNGISSTRWRKLKKEAAFYLDGQKTHWRAEIAPGQTLAVCYTENSSIQPQAGPLSIRYEDDFLLAVDKPSGMLVHPTVARETSTLANYLAHYAAGKACFSGLHFVSRLDRHTAGLVLIAKTARIKHLLQKIYIEKTYTALAHGCPPATSGMIDLPLGRKEGSIIEREVSPQGKPARTHYKLLRNYVQESLIEFKLFTGRTHQIRVHAAAIGCPLVGDSLYGEKSAKTPHCLIARELLFHHPIGGQTVNIKSDFFIKTKNNFL